MRALVGLAVLLLMAALVMPAAAQAPELPEGHGFILIRIQANQRQGVNVFAVTNVESDATGRADYFLSVADNPALIGIPFTIQPAFRVLGQTVLPQVLADPLVLD